MMSRIVGIIFPFLEIIFMYNSYNQIFFNAFLIFNKIIK